LGRISRDAANQRLSGAGQWSQRSVLFDGETGNIRGSAFVEDVEQITVERQADRTDASRIDEVNHGQFVFVDLQNGDLVAAGVDGKQESITRADNQCALRSQWVRRRVGALWNRIAGAASGKCACGTQHAFGGATKYRHLIINLICQNIHRARAEVFPFRSLTRFRSLTECCRAERRQE
jgi:hypothetical protein